jgi:hypothetical protein
LSQSTRDVAVGAGAPIGDLSKLLPNSSLEARSADIQGQVKGALLAVEIVQQDPHPVVKPGRVTMQFGGGVFPPEHGLQLCRRVTEADGTDPLLCRRHQQVS